MSLLLFAWFVLIFFLALAVAVIQEQQVAEDRASEVRKELNRRRLRRLYRSRLHWGHTTEGRERR